MAMRVVGDKEGEGVMAMSTVKRMVGKQQRQQQEGSSNGKEGGGQG